MSNRHFMNLIQNWIPKLLRWKFSLPLMSVNTTAIHSCSNHCGVILGSSLSHLTGIPSINSVGTTFQKYFRSDPLLPLSYYYPSPSYVFSCLDYYNSFQMFLFLPFQSMFYRETRVIFLKLKWNNNHSFAQNALMTSVVVYKY